ncbi:MAG: hypothetical protein IJ608_09370 [Lachnospiraceae bacterium]|nr:hypothetical protein [Lachnospiraceae bacterium]
MRIIDKQHDFYDYLQDPTDRIVFDRRGSFLLSKELFCKGLRYLRYHRDSRYRFVLLQCGVAYWLFLITITAMDLYDRPVDYDMELLANWKNYDGSNELIKIRAVTFNISMWDYWIRDFNPERVKARVSDLKAEVDLGNYRMEHDLGYHTKSTDHKGTFIKEIQDIPILKACGIAEHVDPVSVFCAIEEHFSMEKTASETTEAKGTTDEDKVIMHGFDVKTSFRKMK